MKHEQASWICSMCMQHGKQYGYATRDMRHGHAAWTSNKDMQHGLVAWTCSKDMKNGHAVCACSLDMQHGPAALTSRIDMQHGNTVHPGSNFKDIEHGPAARTWHAALKCTCSRKHTVQHGHAKWTHCKGGSIDMQLGGAALTCSSDIQHWHAL